MAEKVKKAEKVNKEEMQDIASVKTEKKVKAVKAKKVTWEGMSIDSLKLELQKLTLDVRTGREKNTSIIKRLRKHIARELTNLRQASSSAKATEDKQVNK